jgi:hypothetical protein
MQVAIDFPNNTISEIGVNTITYPKNMIQVVDNTFSGNFSVNNWATQNEIATASITPKSASSKILVYVNVHFRGDIGAGNWSLGYIWVRNNSRNVELCRSGWNGTWRNTISNWSRYYLDSPGTTATQTYSIRCGNYPSGAHSFNQNSAGDNTGHIRLMEFAS